MNQKPGSSSCLNMGRFEHQILIKVMDHHTEGRNGICDTAVKERVEGEPRSQST